MPRHLQIIVDTREKKDFFTFKPFEDVKISNDKLDFGDYSVAGYDRPNDDDSVIIERKRDCQELITNLGQKWETFENELRGLSQYKHKQIVVCGPDNFEFLFSRNFTKLHPNFVYKRLAEIYIKYGVSTVFCNCLESAENYVFRLFYEIVRRHAEEIVS